MRRGRSGGCPLSHPEAVEEAALGLPPLLGPRALPATSLTDHRFRLRSQSVQPLTQVSPAGRCVEVQGPTWAAGAPREGTARLLSQEGRPQPRGCLREGTGSVAGGCDFRRGGGGVWVVRSSREPAPLGAPRGGLPT